MLKGKIRLKIQNEEEKNVCIIKKKKRGGGVPKCIKKKKKGMLGLMDKGNMHLQYMVKSGINVE